MRVENINPTPINCFVNITFKWVYSTTNTITIGTILATNPRQSKKAQPYKECWMVTPVTTVNIIRSRRYGTYRKPRDLVALKSILCERRIRLMLNDRIYIAPASVWRTLFAIWFSRPCCVCRLNRCLLICWYKYPTCKTYLAKWTKIISIFIGII